MATVSIIIPAFNVEQYVDACVGSILRSTFQDFELILVDDGSTDGTGQVGDKWAAADERVVVIHQENMGISGARNTGLSHARGEYISFMDADDLVHPRMYEALLNAIQSGDHDFSMVLGKNVHEDEVQALTSDSVDQATAGETSHRSLTQDEMMRGLYALGSFQYKVVWNKLYRKSLIEDMRFKALASEDFEWNNRVFLKARSAAFIESEMYYYLQRSSSIMHQGLNQVVIDRLQTVMECLKNIPEQQRGYRSYCLTYLYKSYAYVRYQCGSRQQSLTERIRAFGKDMFASTRKELLGSGLPLMTKINMIVSYLCPSLYRMRLSSVERK